MSTSARFDELLDKKLLGTITQEEDMALSELISSDAERKKTYGAVTTLDRASRQLQPAPDFDSADAFTRFLASAGAQETIKPSKSKVLSPSSWLSIAASLLVASLCLWYFILDQNNTKTISYSTGKSETKQITLPDGSSVVLNKNSSISFAQTYPESGRNLTLTGEAFFEVKRDEQSPFTVEAGASKTVVLGTSFNIRMKNENEIVIHVITGKVLFSKNEQPKKGLTLTKGEGAILNKSEELTRIGTLENVLAWKSRKLTFKETKLTEVITTLEDYFNATIKIKNQALGHCTFTSHFKQPTITEVLEELVLTIGVKVERKADIIYISGKGCQD